MQSIQSSLRMEFAPTSLKGEAFKFIEPRNFDYRWSVHPTRPIGITDFISRQCSLGPTYAAFIAFPHLVPSPFKVRDSVFEDVHISSAAQPESPSN